MTGSGVLSAAWRHRRMWEGDLCRRAARDGMELSSRSSVGARINSTTPRMASTWMRAGFSILVCRRSTETPPRNAVRRPPRKYCETLRSVIPPRVAVAVTRSGSRFAPWARERFFLVRRSIKTMEKMADVTSTRLLKLLSPAGYRPAGMTVVLKSSRTGYRLRGMLSYGRASEGAPSFGSDRSQSQPMQNGRQLWRTTY